MIPAGLAGTLPLQAGAEAVGKAAEYQTGDRIALQHRLMDTAVRLPFDRRNSRNAYHNHVLTMRRSRMHEG
jgi:CRISPR/Cas system Type II protein with McrA/HNH and RuvC-like nuclease domain